MYAASCNRISGVTTRAGRATDHLTSEGSDEAPGVSGLWQVADILGNQGLYADARDAIPAAAADQPRTRTSSTRSTAASR